MRRVSDTLARIAAGTGGAAPFDADVPNVVRGLNDFGSNPGALKAHLHVPEGIGAHAPLVVVLHGCTQSAAGYDRASGWSRLAGEMGFALLYPEQTRGNNANGCFNWFEPGDTRRDHGEALSIRQMIAAVQARHSIDPARIFVTGLSAGGAMAATMLATYPELFAAGAIIAGLPHGVASGVAQALDRRRGHRLPDEAALQSALLAATDHSGPWPRISIWHGDADATVGVRNAEAILAQWRGVHGVADSPPVADRIDGVPHRAWQGSDGRVLIEEYIVPGMGHGTPLKTNGAGAYGASAPYMLDAGISSTLRIAQFFGIATEAVKPADIPSAKLKPTTALSLRTPQRLHGRRIESGAAPSPTGIGKVIDDALRAAGLMK